MDLAVSRPARVAHAIIENTRNGKAPAKMKTALRFGYSYASAKTMQFEKSPDYQRVMAENKDLFLSDLEKTKKMALARAEKTIKKASYRDAMYGVDIATKNSRLISGESTDNIAVGLNVLLSNVDKLEDMENGTSPELDRP